MTAVIKTSKLAGWGPVVMAISALDENADPIPELTDMTPDAGFKKLAELAMCYNIGTGLANVNAET